MHSSVLTTSPRCHRAVVCLHSDGAPAAPAAPLPHHPSNRRHMCLSLLRLAASAAQGASFSSVLALAGEPEPLALSNSAPRTIFSRRALRQCATSATSGAAAAIMCSPPLAAAQPEPADLEVSLLGRAHACRRLHSCAYTAGCRLSLPAARTHAC